MSGKRPKIKLRPLQLARLRYDGTIYRVEALNSRRPTEALIRPLFENGFRWVPRDKLIILVEHAPA